jgi:hypothetical protein
LDTRFKLDKPSGIDLKSTDTRTIKATRTALDIAKANKKQLKSPKLEK